MIVLAFNWQVARKCQFQLHDRKKNGKLLLEMPIPGQKVPNSGQNEQITNKFDNLINEMPFS